MVCVPALSELVLTDAWPVPSRVALPRDVDPSLKLTEPVGWPAPGADAATLAVKVTFWPAVDGFGEAVTTVVVAALLTSWACDPEVLPLKLVSPPYTATTE